MKANRVHQFGPPEVIAFEDVEKPEPGTNEVLVRVKATGVGPWDAWIRAGKSVLPQPLPLTLGSDLCGTVAAVGAGVTRLEQGNEVFGVTNKQFTGANAEYAVAAADMIAKKPGGLSDIEAASVPVIAVTAWQMLFEHAHIARGETVLVLGGAGNVGAFAVQMAHRAGAGVIATASANDLGYVHELGADEVVNYQSSPFESSLSGIDAVIDTVGGESQRRAFSVLKPGGVLVSSVSQPDAKEAERLGVRAVFFLVNVTTSSLDEIAKRLAEGELKACVGTVLALGEARAAHEMLDGTRPRTRGKIVLVP